MRRLLKRRSSIARGTNRRAPPPLTAPPAELRLVTTALNRIVTTTGNKVVPHA